MRTRTSRARTRAVCLDRHEIDRVARAVASGRRGLGARLDMLADSIASQMTAKLEAAGVRALRVPQPPRVALDRETRHVIVGRVSKHLPVVRDTTSDGSPRTR